MKVKRYIAANSREALANARAEIGQDALVLSSRQTENGFELLALAKGDVAALVSVGTQSPSSTGSRASNPAIRSAAESAPSESPSPATRAQASSSSTDSTDSAVRKAYANGANGVNGAAAQARVWIPPRAASAASARMAPASAPNPSEAATPAAAAPSVAPSVAPGVTMAGSAPELVSEIRALRGMVEEQGAHLAWMQAGAGKSAGLRACLLRELLSAGFSAALARKVAAALPEGLGGDAARLWLERALAKNLRCGLQARDSSATSTASATTSATLADPALMSGVIALVGPTGVGKTTTVAKLAAGCVVRHGAGSLGLISADHYRIGAQDQLRIYGRILGVPVHAVHDAESLRSAREALSAKRLVLIDSTGVGQRDSRVAELCALFEAEGIQRVLLLSAASQAETLEEVVQAYGAGSLAGAIITKTDEAASLGGVLDCAIRHRLCISHVTNGQRVPEDIHPAYAPDLVREALGTLRAPAFRMHDNELDLLASVPPRRRAVAAMAAGR